MFNVKRNKNIKVKHEIDGKINLSCRHIYCGLKKFATIDKEELGYLLESLTEL